MANKKMDKKPMAKAPSKKVAVVSVVAMPKTKAKTGAISKTKTKAKAKAKKVSMLWH